MFQLIQVFFVTALSSSATALIPSIISQPQEIPLLLAQNLPKSSKFYLTYFILQGLGSSASNILNQSDLIKCEIPCFFFFFFCFISHDHTNINGFITPRFHFNCYRILIISIRLSL